MLLSSLKTFGHSNFGKGGKNFNLLWIFPIQIFNENLAWCALSFLCIIFYPWGPKVMRVFYVTTSIWFVITQWNGLETKIYTWDSWNHLSAFFNFLEIRQRYFIGNLMKPGHFSNLYNKYSSNNWIRFLEKLVESSVKYPVYPVFFWYKTVHSTHDIRQHFLINRIIQEKK